MQQSEISRGALAFGILFGFTAAALAVRSKPWRWPMTAAALVLFVWGVPRLGLMTAEAFPTSFFTSPTGYSVDSIAAAL